MGLSGGVSGKKEEEEEERESPKDIILHFHFIFRKDFLNLISFPKWKLFFKVTNVVEG